MTDAIARRGRRHGFARRFVAGETLDEAVRVARELCGSGHGSEQRVILNHLGENVTSVQEARASRNSYVHMLRVLDTAGLDANISIKLTQLGLDQDNGLCVSLVDEIAATAKSLGRNI